ncbi:MAG: 1-deoxy-D-xylulose-5-phosphate reductoisomerase [Candidatus Omnitrophica bacterium]|nr:1-deoxy-D-xylulose-5-phosphate reductoisomerase [Candidatus Omnitrophota bacterium]
MTMKEIILFGSTGSVGRSVLDIVRRYPASFRVKGLTGHGNTELLLAQAEEFRPEFLAITDENKYGQIKRGLPDGMRVLSGEAGLEEMASKDASLIFMAISGTASLKPLVVSLKKGNRVALASKEPVVSAGNLIKSLEKQYGASIIPVDSEHSAAMQCLSGRAPSDVRALYLTGSGGALKDRNKEDFEKLTVEEVLDHPTWDMGPKITVDSATLMNKGLEVIEARWLFDIEPEKIKVVIHPEAVVHSLAEFRDGTVTASLFMPDMRFPVLKALSYPEIVESDLPRVDLARLKGLSFEEPDTSRFPALDLAYEALKEGGTLPAVLNGANEKAVKLFLDNRIDFTDITRSVEKIMREHKSVKDPDLEDILQAEKWGETRVLEMFGIKK